MVVANANDAGDGTHFADDIIATMENQESTGNAGARGRKVMGEAQKQHILKVRAFVETSTNLHACDWWRNILFRPTE